jgi:hypothetical protein
LDLIDGQFSVGFEDFVGLLIFDETGIFLDKLENLLNDFNVFLKDIIKDPLIYPSASEKSGIFEANEVSARFGLGKI